MVTSALPADPLWPRAGSWPSPKDIVGAIDLALIGIPTWRTSLSPTRAEATPAAIRNALRRYSPFAASLDGRNVDDLVFADVGDVIDPDGDEGERRAISAMTDAVGRAAVTVALGGDNAATVPAALGAWGDAIDSAGLVTLDAHHDLRDGVSNGSPVRRLLEAGLDGRRVVQIGIADFANSRAYTDRARDLGITVVRRDDLHGRPMADVLAEALDVAGAAGGPVHVDIDVDVCDRSVAPACPASVPGGLAAHELRAAARAAGRDGRVRSIDITEIDALADAPDGRTVRLAALCVLEIAAGVAAR
ncbi:arginase family protein [Mycetocola zhadangensis]|uniref:Formimidoylglutamase n=1 Tax=Mycetocola zhadangensis TaxID=1164595 RepID=A0A3L7J7Q0_9MICO|nr:arginase family protein [Mycetocola zhadangensis]RLQ84532.1 formimidoylglutamase [Mycetocola zhadangensis]GGE92132.1 formimidoylglutamase [Mycetocola zhadangensis]